MPVGALSDSFLVLAVTSHTPDNSLKCSGFPPGVVFVPLINVQLMNNVTTLTRWKERSAGFTHLMEKVCEAVFLFSLRAFISCALAHIYYVSIKKLHKTVANFVKPLSKSLKSCCGCLQKMMRIHRNH